MCTCTFRLASMPYFLVDEALGDFPTPLPPDAFKIQTDDGA